MIRDAYLNVISLRAIRDYDSRPVPDDVIEQILQAGRATGSSQNKQPWTFYVLTRRETLDRVSMTVYAPENLAGSSFAVAIVGTKNGFDIGRCAQNMMLGASALGVASCPNGIKEPDTLSSVLSLPEGLVPATVITFGYRTNPRPTMDPVGVLHRIKRKPLDDIVVRVD